MACHRTRRARARTRDMSTSVRLAVECWSGGGCPALINMARMVLTGVSRIYRRRPAPPPRWRLDEMACPIGGKRMSLWCAVDDEGEVLDLVVLRRRDTEAALKLTRRLLHNQPVEPKRITTDGLASGGAPLDQLDLRCLHRPARLWRTAGRRTPTCRSANGNADAAVQIPSLAQRFLSTHAAIYDTFNICVI